MSERGAPSKSWLLDALEKSRDEARALQADLTRCQERVEKAHEATKATIKTAEANARERDQALADLTRCEGELEAEKARADSYAQNEQWRRERAEKAESELARCKEERETARSDAEHFREKVRLEGLAALRYEKALREIAGICGPHYEPTIDKIYNVAFAVLGDTEGSEG